VKRKERLLMARGFVPELHPLVEDAAPGGADPRERTFPWPLEVLWRKLQWMHWKCKAINAVHAKVWMLTNDTSDGEGPYKSIPQA
jgi:hypothetical protein